MSLATYSDLKTSVATWIKRSDLTAIIPDFISLAEARINRELRTRNMVTRTQNTAVDSEFVTLPTDFGGARSARLTTTTPNDFLAFLTPEQMTDYKAQNPTGDLSAYSVVGGEFWFLPAPTDAVTVELIYYAKVPALTDSATTNWLMTNHPDVYLWGALMEATVFLEDDEQTQKYAALFAAGLDDVRRNSVSDSAAARLNPSPNTQVV